MKKIAAIITLLLLVIPKVALADDSDILTKKENLYLKTTGVSSVVKTRFVCGRKNYAIIGWSGGEVGGSSIYKKTGKEWMRIAGGGGRYGVNDLTGLGIPYTVADDMYKCETNIEKKMMRK